MVPPIPTLSSLATHLERALRVNTYFKEFPLPKQAAFLLLPQREAFFGGAGGPGKSSALLMGGLQYVDVPGYAGLILRRTYGDLSLPGALMDRAHEWLDDTDAHWDGKRHTWEFPTTGEPSTLTFGYLENERDKFRYRSAEFQYIAYDELTQFTRSQYLYLFTRLRRTHGLQVPLRMRSASNPGDLGHAWVKQRFLVEGPTYGRPFIPARIADNPYLDQAAYRESLSHVDPVTRLQIEEGDWDVLAEGNMFKRGWFPLVTDFPYDLRLVRYWDFAGTEAEAGTSDTGMGGPDWTVGLLVGEKGGQYWVLDMCRDRLTPKGVEDLVVQTATLDGPRVTIHIEQEPGSSGKTVIEDYQRRVLRGYSVYGLRSTGSKVDRAKPASAAAEARNISLMQAPWNSAFLDEVALFPGESHDDIVDALSGAVSVLVPLKRAGFVEINI
jgi:predicted phage terminase large subunit-like protein